MWFDMTGCFTLLTLDILSWRFNAIIKSKAAINNRIQTRKEWYALLLQEITRLGGLERFRGNWAWPLAYVYSLLGIVYFKLRGNKYAEDLVCFGWQCVAIKKITNIL